ncbi:hypothetical protein M3Y98_00584400 [Aphelenchoides besseyi]|nr:hypothetical protein M3Y98_00584400 [Aphelenchoides besseyi]KAI6193913.1 hypothetical protein M3Y96_01069100 [Aphelenchoides besseyi]
MIKVSFRPHDRMLTVLLLALQFAANPASAQLSNSVVEQPYVSCATDAIYAKWKTRQTFTGRVNVRYAPNRFCYQVLVTNNQVELLIPHLECKISRTRSLEPPGLLLETTVLLSFHPEFITEADRLFVLRCLHTRNTTQNGGLNAGEPLTTFPTLPAPVDFDLSISDEFSSTPTSSSSELRCSYIVVHEETNALVKSLRIGTPVRHEWKCEGTREDVCLVVTNCFMKAVDTQFEVIDAYGCSKDRSLIAELSYENKNHVVQHARVFGIADKPFLFYSCELNLVDMEPDRTCPRPKCSSRVTRDVANNETLSLVPLFDVLSQQIEVLPPDVPSEWSEVDCSVTSTAKTASEIETNDSEYTHAFCIAWPVFWLGSTIISMLLIATGVLITIAALRKTPYYHDVAQT